MITNIKCLGTLVLAIFNTFLLLELCECKPQFGLRVLSEEVSGANNPNDALAEVAVEAPAVANGETGDQATKRKWSNFNSWGKRGWDKNFAVWGKRRWDNFAAWGKRDADDDMLSSQSIAQSGPDKRAWSKFTSWGKRTDLDDIDKRRWSSFQTWGKRNTEDYQDELNVDKKWSKFTTWGKRADDEFDLSPEKRKWSQFNSWGKRDDTSDDIDKRKWSQFNAWGKRASELDGNPELMQQMDTDTDADLSPDKRKWSRFASWGKRLRNPKSWAALNTWGKRRWSGLVTWGKRSADTEEPSTATIAQKLLQFFDANGKNLVSCNVTTLDTSANSSL